MMKRSLAFYNKSYLDYYLVIDNKQNFYSQSEVSLDMNKFQKSILYKSLGDDYSKVKILWARDVIFGTNEMSFFVIRYIRQMDSYHAPGILVMKLNDSILDEVRKNITSDDLMYFILDGNNDICFSQLPGGKEWDSDNEENRKFMWEKLLKKDLKQNPSKGILSSAYDENTRLTFMIYAPAEVTNEVLRKIQLTMAAVFGIIYIVSFVGIVIFTRKFIKPIKYLSDTMSHFNEDCLETKVFLNTNTELDSIGHSYNSMLEEVKFLMDDIKKKERELHESQIQSLMYQIHPHFLYNTLDTIYMLARIQKEETIMKMIQALSRFLRINLSNGKEEIEVTKELEHVSSYLDIQKIRNADLFTYEIEIEEKIASLYVMKMILQPIVENSIKHGFRDFYEGGKIKICVFCEEKNLCFSIWNNGSHIEKEAREKLNLLEKMPMEEIDGMIKDQNGGYGICNVVKRLRMKYHDQIRFYYLSRTDGTECIIKIDLQQITKTT